MACNSQVQQLVGNIHALSDLNLLKLISQHLKGENIKYFEESCFGQFLKLRHMLFQDQLYLHLLCNQDSSRSRNHIIFDMYNQQAEFGPREFALVTGLKFGPLPGLPTSSELYNKFFKKRKQGVELDDIKDAFVNSDGESEHSLKLAFLLIVFGLLLIKGKENYKIDIMYLHIVDDLHKFNQFPWGRLAFKVLVDGMRDDVVKLKSQSDNLVVKSYENKPRKRGRPAKKGRELHFYVNGLVYALQCWSFEAFPLVGSVCGSRIKMIDEQREPRMVFWDSFVLGDTFKQLKEKITKVPGKAEVFAENNIVYGRLEPNEWEKKSVSFVSAVEWEEKICLHSKATERDEKLNNLARDNICEELSEEAQEFNIPGCSSKLQENDSFIPGCSINPGEKDSFNPGSSQKTEDINSIMEFVKEQFRSVNSAIKKIEDTQTKHELILTSLMKHCGCQISSDKVSVEECPPSGRHGVGINDDTTGKCAEQCDDGAEESKYANQREGSEGVVEEEVVKEEKCSKNQQLEKGETEKETIQIGDSVEVPQRSKRTLKPRCGVQSSYTVDNRQDRKRVKVSMVKPFIQKIGHCEDPFSAYSKDILAQFNNWFSKNSKTKSKPEIVLRLPLEHTKYVDAAFFKTLKNVRGWLTGENIDVLMHMRLWRANKSPELFERSWTCVDLHFWNMLIDIYPDWKKANEQQMDWDWNVKGNKIMKYVCGELPLDGPSLAWWKAKSVYGVAHVNDNHWVFYEISPKEMHVSVYDSLPGGWPIEKFEQMVEMLPSLCVQGRRSDGCFVEVEDIGEWTIDRVNDAPRQRNTSDCGVLCIKYFEYSITGRSVTEIDPIKGSMFRLDMCCDIYRHSNVFDKTSCM